MSIPRYQFSSENSLVLKDFIKKSNDCRTNPFCNVSVYNKLFKILPMCPVLAEYAADNEIIDLVESDEEQANEQEINHMLSQILQDTNKTVDETVVDTYAIKEILENKNCLTPIVISDIQKPNIDVDHIFQQLFIELNFEKLLNLGISLRTYTITNDGIISSYVKHVLIKQVVSEFSDQLQENLNAYCIKYPEILADELSNYLLNETDNYSRVIFQFVDGLPNTFRPILLNAFISNCNGMEEHNIVLFEKLLEDEVTDDIVFQLVELISKSAEKLSNSKILGKFLLKFTQLLGKKIVLVEKPMNHIIATHVSIWKAKIQKEYDEFIHNDTFLSQSFRY